LCSALVICSDPLQFSATCVDSMAMAVLSGLPPQGQIEALNQFFALGVSEMKNPSAYLSGIVRSISSTRNRSEKASAEQFKHSRVSKHLEHMYRKYGSRHEPLVAPPTCVRDLATRPCYDAKCAAVVLRLSDIPRNARHEHCAIGQWASMNTADVQACVVLLH
jgi:hypothetical protein